MTESKPSSGQPHPTRARITAAKLWALALPTRLATKAHKLIVLVTYGLLTGAFGLAIWSFTRPRYAAASTAFAVASSITGLIIDRWITTWEKRQELLAALVHELYMNLHVLADPLFSAAAPPVSSARVFPRIYMGTLDAVVASGVFTQPRDRELFRLMNSWRQRAIEFNARLDIAELRMFVVGAAASEIVRHHSKLKSGAVLRAAQKALEEVTAHLLDNYATQSGIERDTVLFPTS